MANKTVFGDRDRIGQVIVNMLTNAIKYSPHSVTILVRTIADKENVTLCVQDFGVGIPKERQHPRDVQRAVASKQLAKEQKKSL